MPFQKRNKVKLGKKHTKETKRKMRESHADFKGEKHPMWGKHHSEESKKKMSSANKGKRFSSATEFKKGMKDEKCPAWRGGISEKNHLIRTSLDFLQWREKVFKRDNYICQLCGQRGGRLHTHHIKNFSQYPKLRFNINNGITLCKKCHKVIHNKYGYKTMAGALC